MECKVCGTEVVEGAVFCAKCGARVDGKKPCPKCEQLNSAENAYCIYCGARIDGKIVCKNCGTTFDGSFCPQCGTGKAVAPAPAKARTAEKRETSGLFKKICDIVSGASMMLGVLFALIFVFFIGIVLKEGGTVIDKNTIFYYFGDAYKDIEEANIAEAGFTKWYQDLISSQMNLNAIIGTVLSALILIAVITFATIAIVKYVLSWTRKTENKANGFALACVISFFIGTALFLAYGNAKISMSAASGNIGSANTAEAAAKGVFSGPTVAALVLCGISIAIGIASHVVGNWREIFAAKNLSKLVCAGVGTVLAVVVIALAENSLFAVNLEIGSGTLARVFQSLFGIEVSGVKFNIDLAGGYMAMNELWDLMFASMYTNNTFEKYAEVTFELEKMNIFNIVTQAFVFLLVVFSGLALRGHLRGLVGKEGCGLVWSVGAFVSSIVILVFSLLSYSSLANIFEMMKMEFFLNNKVGVSICAIVFSLLLMVLSIIRMVIGKSQKTEAVAE